jgi:hypothetical protein
MRDSRIFHIEDSDWIKKYNNQVTFEAQKSEAWTEGGPELIIEEAQKRLRKEGWDSLRPALSVTIRFVYFLRLFVHSLFIPPLFLDAGLCVASWKLACEGHLA